MRKQSTTRIPHPPDYPKKAGEWAGRQVRLLRQVELRSGAIYQAGTTWTVWKKYGDLKVQRINSCPTCGNGNRQYLEIPVAYVELLPREEAANEGTLSSEA